MQWFRSSLFRHGRRGPAEAKALLHKALDGLFRGVEELRALSKTMLAGHQFYFYETRRGIDQHMLAAANLDGYVVLVELGAHNEKMVKELESCFQHVVFFAPTQVRQYITADAQPYEGPAISSHRLARLPSQPAPPAPPPPDARTPDAAWRSAKGRSRTPR